MTANEIIAKVDETLQDTSISPTLAEINSAVSFIASQTYLPSLIVASPVKFTSSVSTVTDATNAAPIVITTDIAHGLSTGDSVDIVDVLGNDAANAKWYIEVLTDTTFSLLASQGSGDYISGGTVTKRDGFVSLPVDYDHDLFEAFSISQNIHLNIRSNLRAMGVLHDAEQRIDGTAIEDVAAENGLLYCMPTGNADDIVMCRYYRKPNDMALTTESPGCIPAHLHESIIVQYILSLKWLLIEDGHEESFTNTNRAVNAFSAGIMALSQYYPRPSLLKPAIARNIIWF